MTQRKHRSPKVAPIPAEGLDRTPRLALVFTDETVWATRFDPTGTPIVTYPVAAVDVANAFNASTADSGLLPPDVLFWQRRKGATRLGVWLPPRVRAISFATGRRTRTVRLPLPGFVFVGAGGEYQIWAAQERPTKGEDALYHAPLPNVDEHGRICFGNAHPPACSPATIGPAVELFFTTNFNTHLSENKIRSQGAAEREEEEEDDDENLDWLNEDDEDDEELPEQETDAFAIAHHGGRVARERPARRRRPVSLVRFLQDLKGKRTFPLRELVPGTTLAQLIAARSL